MFCKWEAGLRPPEPSCYCKLEGAMLSNPIKGVREGTWAFTITSRLQELYVMLPNDEFAANDEFATGFDCADPGMLCLPALTASKHTWERSATMKINCYRIHMLHFAITAGTSTRTQTMHNPKR